MAEAPQGVVPASAAGTGNGSRSASAIADPMSSAAPSAAAVRPGTATVFSGGGTGGHLYPALALADALRDIRPDVRAVFVGAERGIEARVLPARGLEHLLVPVEGFRRGLHLANLTVLRSLAQALAAVGGLFHRLRPSLVVVTGGYAGGPAGLVAGLMGIRLVLQEQNSVPGLTTRVLSLWAREVHLAFPEAVARLPRLARPRARISGNPVRPPHPVAREDAAEAFHLDASRPVVLVVGGSQGARAVNEAVLDGVRRILAGEISRPGGLQLLWVTGPDHLTSIREALEETTVASVPGSESIPTWIRLHGYLEAMPMALALADLAVSRAGAMATSEFLARGIPSLLIPFPFAAADHQARNAQALAEAGAAEHLPESELDPDDLWARIRRLLEDRETLDSMARAARQRGRPDAALEIARSLAAHLPPTWEGS
ncbi:MAG: UDP-N-acetylglucosamine--N-acetylmuramyl-(pentapeptide) pyrophosphoryl-undecaprenol N-acetylglucosamine transferase [Gemmatimonadales bacterium]|nr:MAG: UDP-N-acetylglucosamine--N-acetylmuramyl-(pentapeptide) pyrophosphoryl-undecaprenol N-acetylglucosamine transferase [Gemmatimonadales bacterium]